MKQFNLLKEVHGIRAKLTGPDYQPERRTDKKGIYLFFLLVIAGIILYEMFPILEFVFKNSETGQSSTMVVQESKIQKSESETQDSIPHTPIQDKITAPPSGEVISSPQINPAPMSARQAGVENEDMIKSKADIIKSEVALKDSNSPPLVKKEKEGQKKRYIIRVATCVLKESADVVQRDLKGKGFSSYQKMATGYIKGKITNLHKVYVGNYNSKQDVLLVVDKLKANGFSAIVEEKENG